MRVRCGWKWEESRVYSEGGKGVEERGPGRDMTMYTQLIWNFKTGRGQRRQMIMNFVNTTN
jgi:hypothetical protein